MSNELQLLVRDMGWWPRLFARLLPGVYERMLDHVWPEWRDAIRNVEATR